jgi:REP element-mobilizing transposase RayT
MPYDPSKHHRRSIRLKGYDYSQPGAYFVTICVEHRECLFGEIVNAEMHCNTFGDIVWKWWNELPNYYAPVVLDAFVVMPNHIHGIVVISDVGAGSSRPMSTPTNESGRDDPATTIDAPKKRTLGQLMGYFKFEITKEINALCDTGYAKVLQRDYYEHIIRNEREWDAIATYIYNNPANWDADLDNPANFPKRPPPTTADEYWRDAGL